MWPIFLTCSKGTEDISNYLATFKNKNRYSHFGTALTSPITNGDGKMEVDGLSNGMATLNLFEDRILYPSLFRHEDKADRYLVSHCEFIEFSREMINIKIDDDLQKESFFQKINIQMLYFKLIIL